MYRQISRPTQANAILFVPTSIASVLIAIWLGSCPVDSSRPNVTVTYRKQHRTIGSMSRVPFVKIDSLPGKKRFRITGTAATPTSKPFG